jgi:RNA polymerase-interacting CarD/CdnL/TRCF family regulator
VEEITVPKSEIDELRENDSIEVIRKLMEKNQDKEFKYSQNNTYNDAIPTH